MDNDNKFLSKDDNLIDTLFHDGLHLTFAGTVSLLKSLNMKNYKLKMEEVAIGYHYTRTGK